MIAYISSDGTKKDVKELNYEYLINAFGKSAREIFNAQNIEEFNKYITNMQVLEKEIFERIDKFLTEKMGDETWE